MSRCIGDHPVVLIPSRERWEAAALTSAPCAVESKAVACDGEYNWGSEGAGVRRDKVGRS